MKNCIYMIIYILVQYEYEKDSREIYHKDKYFCKTKEDIERRHGAILGVIIFLSKHQLVYIRNSFLHIKLLHYTFIVPGNPPPCGCSFSDCSLDHEYI